MMCSIYKITNSINSKVYIGQTWGQIKKRFDYHKSPQNISCIHLRRALDKHGRDNFQIETIAACSDQVTADYLECLYIKEYDSIFSGYNIRGGGSRGAVSEETKNKLSAIHKGKRYSIKTEFKTGQKFSEDTKKKMSEAQRGSKNHNFGKPTHTKGSTWKLINGKRVYSKRKING
jgi:group I intron endonuclease